MAEPERPGTAAPPSAAELEQILAELEFFLHLEELESLPLEQDFAAAEAEEGEDDGDE